MTVPNLWIVLTQLLNMLGSEICLKPSACLRQCKGIERNIPRSLIAHFTYADKLIDLGLKARNRIWNVGRYIDARGGWRILRFGTRSQELKNEKKEKRTHAEPLHGRTPCVKGKRREAYHTVSDG